MACFLRLQEQDWKRRMAPERAAREARAFTRVAAGAPNDVEFK